MSESNELRVSIPSQSLDEMAAHAFACFPEECCGLLVGDRASNTTVQFVPITNVAHSAKVYTIDPKEHLRAELAARLAPSVRATEALLGRSLPWG